jgi:hypothetical protein
MVYFCGPFGRSGRRWKRSGLRSWEGKKLRTKFDKKLRIKILIG